jgi:hypothetical protein
MERKYIFTILLFLLIYLASYVWIRQASIEFWEKDGQAYVIFPADKVFLYYLYRPLSYVDGKFTGMRFHIGPHQ